MSDKTREQRIKLARLKRDVAQYVEQRIDELDLGIPSNMLAVAVKIDFVRGGKIKVALDLPRLDEVPEDLWAKVFDKLPFDNRNELRFVLEAFRQNGNRPMTIEEMSRMTQEAVGYTMRKEKLSNINRKLKEAQPGENPLFQVSVYQEDLRPGESPRYHIRKRRKSG